MVFIIFARFDLRKDFLSCLTLFVHFYFKNAGANNIGLQRNNFLPLGFPLE